MLPVQLSKHHTGDGRSRGRSSAGNQTWAVGKRQDRDPWGGPQDTLSSPCRCPVPQRGQ